MYNSQTSSNCRHLTMCIFVAFLTRYNHRCLYFPNEYITLFKCLKNANGYPPKHTKCKCVCPFIISSIEFQQGFQNIK